MEEANVLQTSAVEGSRTTLDESVMPPPSSRGLKRKAQDAEPAPPVSPTVSPNTLCLCASLLTRCPLCPQTGDLNQQQQTQGSRASAVSQQLETSSVDLPPEEPTTTTNLSQLIELDLFGDKDKKKDDDSDEEVTWTS